MASYPSFILRLLACVLASLSLPVSAHMATVGRSADCDYVAGPGHSAVMAAVLAGATDIRLQAGPISDQPTAIGGRSVTITGGYTTCAAAQAPDAKPDPELRSQLGVSGDGIRPLTIVALGEPQTVVLRQLHVLDGRVVRPVSTEFGGGLSAFGLPDIRIEDSLFEDLDSVEAGGAISYNGGSLSLIRSRIENNRSRGDGGGVHCRNGSLLIDADSRIAGNHALGSQGDLPGDGGGIHADTCEVTVLARAKPAANMDTAPGLISNQARRHGGAIRAIDTTLRLWGGRHCDTGLHCPNQPLMIHDNRADRQGDREGKGGALSMLDSHASAVHFVVRHNRAHHGGAFHVETSDAALRSQLTLGAADLDGALQDPRDLPECWSQTRCNWLHGNRAMHDQVLTQGTGGAFLVESSRLIARRLWIDGQYSDHGAVGVVDGLGGWLSLYGSVLVDNGRPQNPASNDRTLLLAANTALVEMAHSTVVDNTVLDSVFRVQSNGFLRLYNNILFGSGVPLAAYDVVAPQDGRCNLTDGPLQQTDQPGIVVDDAGFIDREGWDLRLGADAVAIDLCQFAHAQARYDLQGLRRGIALTPGPGTFDAGAFESLGNDRIFANGFRPAQW